MALQNMVSKCKAARQVLRMQRLSPWLLRYTGCMLIACASTSDAGTDLRPSHGETASSISKSESHLDEGVGDVECSSITCNVR